MSSKRNERLLFEACEKGSVEEVIRLLNQKTNVNCKDEGGRTPLFNVCEKGNMPLVELLLRRGADKNAISHDGSTLLHTASRKGAVSLVTMLINRGADVRAVDKLGRTPLHWACNKGHLPTADILLNFGADVKAMTTNGNTPLHFVSRGGCLAVTELIISKGADVNAVDNDGSTPLHWACAHGHTNVAKLLLSRGADENIVDKHGKSALHYIEDVSTRTSLQESVAQTPPQPPPTAQQNTNNSKHTNNNSNSSSSSSSSSNDNGKSKSNSKSNSNSNSNSNSSSKSKTMPSADAKELQHHISAHASEQSAIAAEKEEQQLALQRRITDLEQQLHQLSQSLITREEEFGRSLRAQQARNKQLQQQLQQSASAATDEKARNIDLARRVQEVSTTIAAKDKQIAELTANAATQQTLLTRNLHAQQEHCRDLERQLQQIVTSEAKEKAKNAELTLQLQQMTSAQTALEEELEKLRVSSTDRILNIPAAEVEIGHKLGEGGFGEVFAGTWAYQPVAVKRCRVALLAESEEREILAELETMYHLQHRHVVRLFGVCRSGPGKTEGQQAAMIVMEYGANGSLYALLRSSRELDWSLRLRICEELASGLAYLHMKKIIHRDIKSMNVILDEHYHAKWCDFGLAVLKRTTSAASIRGSHAGTANWMAPELCDDSASVVSFSVMSDVWALGMVFFEVVSRKLPFQNLTNMQMMFRVLQGGMETVPEECKVHAPELALLMERCWQRERLDRPTAALVLETLKQMRQSSHKDDESLSQQRSADAYPSHRLMLTTRRGNLRDDLQAIATVRFTNIIRFDAFTPKMSCVEFLQSELGSLMPQLDTNQLIQTCAETAKDKLNNLSNDIAPLTMDEAVAVVAYTANIDIDQPERNLYYVLNQLLRERHGPTIKRLRPYLFYLLGGLAKLPVYEGVVYRGLPAAALSIVQANYRSGHTVQWSAITSTTTEEAIAKSETFAGSPGGIVFCLRVRTGRRVAAYSAFPDESEVVLSPNVKLTVTAPCKLQSDGYYIVELVEQADAKFVF